MSSMGYVEGTVVAAMARAIMFEKMATKYSAAEHEAANVLLTHDHTFMPLETNSQRCAQCGLDVAEIEAERAELRRLEMKYRKMAENALRAGYDVIGATLETWGYSR